MSAATHPPAPEGPDLLDIIEDDVANPGPQGSEQRWKTLVVDDDPEVHAATSFALAKVNILGRPLELISAYSAAEGRVALEDNPDIAVILLDVVMEEHDSGLRFVEWIRSNDFKNQRIILRTGQSGYAPELDVIRDYDINDYRNKAELSKTRLITCITTAVRMFRQLSQLDERRWELETFSYALAHDFKQAARQINTYSEIVASPHEYGNQFDASVALAHLNGAVRRLSSLIDVMSQYTLLSQPPKIVSVDLPALLDEVRAALQEVLTKTGGELITSGSGRCQGNSALMGGVLQILIANGLQHNDRATPKVTVSLSFDDARCTISVQDNGVGISATDLAKVFAPYMRLRPSDDLSGTGLGLTLSRRAIESQGGAIWCESTPGSGSTFHVAFPYALADGPSTSPQDGAAVH